MIVQGFGELISWPTPFFVVAGTLFGLACGVMPGLSGAIGLALLIPVTLTMEPGQAIAMLGAALGGTTFGGSITAILINTPGTPVNAATCIDGYPMAQKGRGGEAIGAAAAASATGALIGLVIFVAIVPVMRETVSAFRPPELFMVAVFGLTIIASLSRKSMLAGLTAGAFGLMLSYIGQSTVALDSRYMFGQLYLMSGMQLVPVLIGLFAVAEMIRLYVLNRSVAEGVKLERGGGFAGIKQVLKHPFIVLRSALIGIGIGAVPGVGGTVSAFVAYSITQQNTKGPSTFGGGDIRGVITTESANDATDAGSLMPTLALGIPGNPSTAVLLAGLILHGTFPGRQLLTEDLHIVFTLVGSLAVANVLTSAVGLAAARHLARLTVVDVGILVPLALSVTVFGSYAVRNSVLDALAALAFGGIGYLMMRFGFSRIPTVIGLILGGIMEQAFHTSLQMSGGSPWIFFTRPVSGGFFLVTVLSVLFMARRVARDRSTSMDRESAPREPVG